MYILSRDSSDASDRDAYFGPSTIAFLVVIILTFCVSASLLYLRRCRRQALRQVQQQQLQQRGLLPQYNSNERPHRTLTIATSSSNARSEAVYVYDEKMNLIGDAPVSPNHSVPEIRVTFPDEEGSKGQTNSERVVVVRISDSGSVGMEPLSREPLPPYQQGDAERFQSLDLERIGGLKEKANGSARYS